jgi:hypothetical protein
MHPFTRALPVTATLPLARAHTRVCVRTAVVYVCTRLCAFTHIVFASSCLNLQKGVGAARRPIAFVVKINCLCTSLAVH